MKFSVLRSKDPKFIVPIVAAIIGAGGFIISASIGLVPDFLKKKDESGVNTSAINSPINQKPVENQIKNSGNIGSISNNHIDKQESATNISIRDSQIANTINNYGLPKRTISPDKRNEMIELLKSNPVSTIGFANTQGNNEAAEYKELLMGIFKEGGWTVNDQHYFMFSGNTKGLVVTIPINASDQGAPQIAMQCLAITEQPLQGDRGDMANGSGIFIQVWGNPKE